ncbi:MAG: nitrous oxide reductase accessory protein NosL [Thermodesulfobacteriota bacterium]
MRRREFLKSAFAGAGLLLAATPGAKAADPSAGNPTDGTPMQFIPKKAADPQAAENDIAKYPKCPYCGMDRRQYHHSRMLVHYSDDLADGTCSLHCAAISLSINVDRGPKAIYVADNGSAADPKPLIEAGNAVFLVGSSLKGVMTARSKVAYGTEAAAKASQAANGGELAEFDKVLLAAYADMAQDVAMIRKRRAERMKMQHQHREHDHK